MNLSENISFCHSGYHWKQHFILIWCKWRFHKVLSYLSTASRRGGGSILNYFRKSPQPRYRMVQFQLNSRSPLTFEIRTQPSSLWGIRTITTPLRETFDPVNLLGFKGVILCGRQLELAITVHLWTDLSSENLFQEILMKQPPKSCTVSK